MTPTEDFADVTLACDHDDYEVKIVKEVKRSDSLCCFDCGNVLAIVVRTSRWCGVVTRVDRAHPLLALSWPGPGILSAWGQIIIIDIGSQMEKHKVGTQSPGTDQRCRCTLHEI